MKMPTSVYAEESGVSKNSQIAIVKNVLDDGSNLTDDLHISSNTTIQNVLVNIEEQSDSALQITSIIGNSEISVTGVPWQSQPMDMQYSIRQQVIILVLKL